MTDHQLLCEDHNGTYVPFSGVRSILIGGNYRPQRFDIGRHALQILR